MDFTKILEVEQKIKDMENEIVSLKAAVEIEKSELRKKYDPCPTCGRSDKQEIGALPTVWVYPTVYPAVSSPTQYYCYACNIWHYNSYVCNKPIQWFVNGTSVPNNNIDILDTSLIALA